MGGKMLEETFGFVEKTVSAVAESILSTAMGIHGTAVGLAAKDKEKQSENIYEYNEEEDDD